MNRKSMWMPTRISFRSLLKKMLGICLLVTLPGLPVISVFGADYLVSGKDLVSEKTVKNAQELNGNISVDLGGGVKLELVLIRPGTFMMGDKDMKPVHKVTLTKPFYMGKYEVTQEQWQAVVGNNPSSFKDGEDAGKRPVEQVSWDDINSKFLPKLAERMTKGLKPRLPTEAEWEYCCRAGTTGDYAGELDEMGWHNRNSGKMTHPVGQKRSNAWGLYDMHGNVWEWCSDWYGEYLAADLVDPKGVPSDIFRVYRGGAWFYVNGNCSSTFRGFNSPGNGLNNLGFRLAMDITP